MTVVYDNEIILWWCKRCWGEQFEPKVPAPDCRFCVIEMEMKR